ncbi:MAG: hypothetical protein ACREHF_09635 [Rhizomicrobium sp.]
MLGVVCCAPAAPDSARTIAPPNNINLHRIDASPSVDLPRGAMPRHQMMNAARWAAFHFAAKAAMINCAR